MNREQWSTRLNENGNALGALLGISFGQDWVDDYGKPWTNVVDGFVRERRRDRAVAALAELDELLAGDLADADLEWLLLEGVHAAVDWDRFGYPTWRAWLQALRDELARLC